MRTAGLPVRNAALCQCSASCAPPLASSTLSSTCTHATSSTSTSSPSMSLSGRMYPLPLETLDWCRRSETSPSGRARAFPLLYVLCVSLHHCSVASVTCITRLNLILRIYQLRSSSECFCFHTALSAHALREPSPGWPSIIRMSAL